MTVRIITAKITAETQRAMRGNSQEHLRPFRAKKMFDPTLPPNDERNVVWDLLRQAWNDADGKSQIEALLAEYSHNDWWPRVFATACFNTPAWGKGAEEVKAERAARKEKRSKIDPYKAEPASTAHLPASTLTALKAAMEARYGR